MHNLQKLLIKRLVEENGRSFASLTKGYDAEDNIVFHLKKLISDEFVEKKDEKYFITPKGINTLNTFQKTDLQDNAFKMFFVGIVCKNGNDYLIKPHNNAKDVFHNLPSGSPLFAEDLEVALPRIFYDETSLNLGFDRFVFNALHMKTIQTSSGEILFDDAFGIYSVETSDNERVNMTLKKGCVWMHIDQIVELKNCWPEIEFCILKKDWEVYKKYTVICDYVLR